MLKENIIKFNLNPDDFDFYLETFKYGMPPHGGFAIGLERLTMKILKLSNIREAALVPRDMKRLTPWFNFNINNLRKGEIIWQ